MMIPSKIADLLKEAESICILPHISVDGDGLGSSLALGLALQKLSKPVCVILEERVPDIYNFLPGSSLLGNTGKNENYDVVIALDTGDMGRLGKRAEIFNNAKVNINVDHHQTNSEFGFYNYVNSSAAAAGEIVYELIKMMEIDISPEIAKCLYVAIATDTGGFRYSNTSGETHRIAGELLEYGIDVAEISKRIFDTTSLEKVMLMEKAINTLEIYENGKVAFITITDEMIRSVGAVEEDCDGFVNIARNISGVEVAAMLRRKGSGEIKVNLRSNSYVDVSALAELHNGGGHKRAAGCILNEDVETVKKILLEDIKEALFI